MPGTLLVIDDALIIREMIKDAAIQAGWTIVGEATNGKEAIEIYQTVGQAIRRRPVARPPGL